MKLLAVENHPAQAAMKMIHVFCAGLKTDPGGDGGGDCSSTCSSGGLRFSVSLFSWLLPDSSCPPSITDGTRGVMNVG